VNTKPQLDFIIDAKTDSNNAIDFYDYAPEYIYKFLPKELHYLVTNDKLPTQELVNVITRYTNDKFEDEEKNIKNNTESLRKRWNEINPEYFVLTDNIFNVHPWQNGPYVGYASIFGMYPRHIKEKTFHYPAFSDTNTAIKVVGHEMLHFIFFDYLWNKYNIGEDTVLPGKEDEYVWCVSEVFNLVIESWQPYQKIFNTEAIPYDDRHKKMLPEMMKYWQENKNIDYLLEKYFASQTLGVWNESKKDKK